jgi:hypothetical protein
MDKIVKSAAVLVFAGLFSAGVAAELKLENGGATLVPPAVNTGAVAPSEQASTIRDTRKPGGHTLRCWQHGRLLYEGSGFRTDLERGSNAITVQRTDGDPVVVLDLKDSVCMLSKS